MILNEIIRAERERKNNKKKYLFFYISKKAVSAFEFIYELKNLFSDAQLVRRS